MSPCLTKVIDGNWFSERTTKFLCHVGVTQTVTIYLSLPPTRHDLTQGQKPEGRLKWG